MTDTARNGSDMLEKLARTLYEADHFTWGEPDYAVLDNGIQEAYRRAVLKLLDALAEPTPGMWDRAETEHMVLSDQFEQVVARRDRGEPLSPDEQRLLDDAFSFPTARIWGLVVGYRAMLSHIRKGGA
jgi:ABC-type uncharacterized transport system involved in gliding motility auxiliary subunit